MEPKNNLRQIRQKEGLFTTQLAKLANVSPRSVDRVEDCKKRVSPITKNKIVKGLNKNPDKLRDYKYRDVYPNDGKRPS